MWNGEEHDKYGIEKAFCRLRGVPIGNQMVRKVGLLDIVQVTECSIKYLN